jgi:hypothetical protein
MVFVARRGDSLGGGGRVVIIALNDGYFLVPVQVDSECCTQSATPLYYYWKTFATTYLLLGVIITPIWSPVIAQQHVQM